MASDDSSERRLHPGPLINSVLHMQSIHRSEVVWMEDPNYKSLNVRSGRLAGLDVIPEPIVPYLRRAGFLGAARMGRMEIDSALVTALVERWRPETLTFHMQPGEVTMTLQDVAMITGLPTDGEPVTGMSETRELKALVPQLLGRTPSPADFKGGTLKMSWLDANFANVEEWMNDEENLLRFTRAYILRLIGGFLLADHSGGKVHLRYLPFLNDLKACGRFSWGSAVLAFLYRELCIATSPDRIEISGALVVLQMWAWARFFTIAPDTIPPLLEFDDRTPVGVRWTGHKTIFHDLPWYRERFDRMTKQEIIWTPYEEIDLPDHIQEISDRWRAVTPMICFQIVEYHQPDRVLRQFGMCQHIPKKCLQPEEVHHLTLRGKTEVSWPRQIQQFVQRWTQRDDEIQNAPPHPHDLILGPNSEYMIWYRGITRRWITRKACHSGLLTDRLQRVHYMCQTREPYEQIQKVIEHMLNMQAEYDRVSYPGEAASTPTQLSSQPIVVGDWIPRTWKERKGLALHRPQIEHATWELPHLHPRGHGMFYAEAAGPSQSYLYPDDTFISDQEPPSHHESPLNHQPSSYDHSPDDDHSPPHHSPVPHYSPAHHDSPALLSAPDDYRPEYDPFSGQVVPWRGPRIEQASLTFPFASFTEFSQSITPPGVAAVTDMLQAGTSTNYIVSMPMEQEHGSMHPDQDNVSMPMDEDYVIRRQPDRRARHRRFPCCNSGSQGSCPIHDHGDETL